MGNFLHVSYMIGSPNEKLAHFVNYFVLTLKGYINFFITLVNFTVFTQHSTICMGSCNVTSN